MRLKGALQLENKKESESKKPKVKTRLWTLPLGYLKTNCYIIAAEGSRDAAVIDPGDEHEKIVQVLEENGLFVRLILLTHGHWDHIGAVADLFDYAAKKVESGAGSRGRRYGLGGGTLPAVLLHERDAGLLEEGSPRPVTPAGFLEQGDQLRIGSLEINVLHTPGHTPGGLCFLVDGMVFTGDTLFAGAIGRTDFPGGSQEQLIESIRTKLLSLPDQTVVYPGHDVSSTIGQERLTNPYLK
jgi:glyoxylase-like metal-dependent hydrolase (beta-lactamase superfamily II)